MDMEKKSITNNIYIGTTSATTSTTKTTTSSTTRSSSSIGNLFNFLYHYIINIIILCINEIELYFDLKEVILNNSNHVILDLIYTGTNDDDDDDDDDDRYMIMSLWIIIIEMYFLLSFFLLKAITITNARWLFLTKSLQKLGQYLGKSLIYFHYNNDNYDYYYSQFYYVRQTFSIN